MKFRNRGFWNSMHRSQGKYLFTAWLLFRYPTWFCIKCILLCIVLQSAIQSTLPSTESSTEWSTEYSTPIIQICQISIFWQFYNHSILLIHQNTFIFLAFVEKRQYMFGTNWHAFFKLLIAAKHTALRIRSVSINFARQFRCSVSPFQSLLHIGDGERLIIYPLIWKNCFWYSCYQWYLISHRLFRFQVFNYIFCFFINCFDGVLQIYILNSIWNFVTLVLFFSTSIA